MYGQENYINLVEWMLHEPSSDQDNEEETTEKMDFDAPSQTLRRDSQCRRQSTSLSVIHPIDLVGALGAWKSV